MNEWKRGCVIVLAAFIVTFITDGLLYSFGIMLVEIIDHFDEGRATSSVIIAVHGAAGYCVGPLASALGEKYGHRIIVIIGALLSCMGYVLSWFATSVYQLWITYGLIGGLGFGLMYLSANVCVLQHFKKHRALATGIATTGSGIGAFVCNYCISLLIGAYGWKGTMLIQAGFVLQGVVLGLLLAGWKAKNVVERPEKSTTLVSKIKSLFFSVFKPELLKDIRCVTLLLAVILIALALFIPFTYIPDQAEQAGMTKTEAAILTSSIGIGNTVSRVIFGWIGDRICFCRLTLLIVVVLFNGLVTGLSTLMETFETKLVYTSLFGTLIGGNYLLYVVIADIVKPELIPSALGLVMVSLGIGISLGPPFAGFLFDLTGSYTSTFIICGAEFILGAILLFICKLLRSMDYPQTITLTADSSNTDEGIIPFTETAGTTVNSVIASLT